MLAGLKLLPRVQQRQIIHCYKSMRAVFAIMLKLEQEHALLR